MNKWEQMYKEKLRSADEVAAMVKSGDVVEYDPYVKIPRDLDRALAKRKDELEDVLIKVCTLMYQPEVNKVDPQGDVFLLNDSSFGFMSRRIKEKGDIYINPGLYHEVPGHFSHNQLNDDFFYIVATPMDKNGYFNLSVTCSYNTDVIRMRSTVQPQMKVVIEVNDKLPVVQGDTSLHISEVDFVVEEKESEPLMAIGKMEPSDIDRRIAEHIMNEMVDGACLQLGIGGIPNLIGKMLVDSDFKDLGCHSELFVDAFMDLFNAGKLTNAKKKIEVGKSVFTFAMGSEKLYDFMNNNPSLRCLPVGYTNDPKVIQQNDNVYSICSCLAVDLFGIVSSESVGFKQISGIGGQLDYHYAAFHSNGGKAFVCMPSSKVLKDGTRVSNIVPHHIPGTQVSVPGAMTNYVVTEYGAAFIKGLPLWAKVEKLINIAHPDFRDDLFREAERVRIWKPNNKRTMFKGY